MRTVVTYRHAYVPGQSTLCAPCAEAPPAGIPVLGPVQHGKHAGPCDVCDGLSAERRAWDAAQERRMQREARAALGRLEITEEGR